MSNTKNFAERELNILSKSETDPDNRAVIEEFRTELLALADKFGNSGQSGGSAPYIAEVLSQTIKKLCLQKPICPITGIDEEWIDVGDHSSSTSYNSKNRKYDLKYQNSRCFALFKNNDGNSYYLDAISWRDQNGLCWSGYAKLPNGETILSQQFLRKFPFNPKTFYVDVLSIEEDNNSWEKYIKDEKQLEEAFNYYKSPWDRAVIVEKFSS